MSNKKQGQEGRVRVRDVRRTSTDLKKLASVVIALAQAQAEAEAEAESKSGQAPNARSGDGSAA